jgi:DNA polymerase delta subunit 3
MVDRMLYEFHRIENGKKPGTIHATYLICGTKCVEEPEVATAPKKDGEDEYMQSSPFMNSTRPQAVEGTGASSTLTITLTREEDLGRMNLSLLSLPSTALIAVQKYAHNTNK